MAYINNLGQVRVGVRGWVAAQSGASVTDSDATAFITAAGITDSTQISALNTLVTDLKTYGLWTKMKVIYPFVGGSAASHKWNLKDPRDLDAAFRLVFNGGWVHSSNGALPNGTTGYANTYYNPSSLLNPFIGYYSRSNTNTNTDQIDMGCSDGTKWLLLSSWYKTTTYNYILARNSSPFVLLNGGIQSDSRGWYWTNKISNVAKLGRNSNILTTADDTINPPNASIGIGAMGSSNTSANYFSNRETVFSVIADGLSDTETSNLYISIQKFQTTLGRQVGTPYVSDPDAIAFLMAAGITDGTQAVAINTLVIRMKADGVWTKMKAIYPFVGGTAASHKWNLKDPRDLDAAYRLVFNGGWAHTGTGALPNASNTYADTKLIPNSALTLNSTHLSFYSRTDSAIGGADFGLSLTNPSMNMFTKWTDNYAYHDHYSSGADRLTINMSGISTSAFFISTRTSNTSLKVYRNGNQIGVTTINQNVNSLPTSSIWISAHNSNGSYSRPSNRETSFASIGDGLTDAEATSLYNAVQAYQTTLGRQVNVPLVSDTDAQAFLNAANITSFQQASAVNKLVTDLKATGIWSKMKAIYPFVGGSATSHKFNLKDPRDLDAAFRLVFNGGWTHTSTGALPNGTTGYADTKFNPITISQSLSSTHLSVYTTSTNTSGVSRGYIGSMQTDVINYTALGWFYGGTMEIGVIGDGSAGYTGAISSFTGFKLTSTNGSRTNRYFKNGVKTGSDVTQTGNFFNANMYLGAINYIGSPAYYQNVPFTFTTIGDGLTDAEVTTLYTAVQTYQTSLGRAVNTPVYNNGLVLNLDAGNANSYPGNGTTWFDLAAGNNGTLVNGPTYDTANGGSLLFDGVNDYVDLGSNFKFVDKDLTLDFWVKCTDNSLSNWHDIIVMATPDQSSGVGLFKSRSGNSANGSFQFSFIGNHLYSTLIGSQIVSAGVLNLTGVVKKESGLYKLYLYVNGVLDKSLNTTTSSYDMNTFTNFFARIGSGGPTYPEIWQGNIYSGKVYTRALSATEILNNFNSTRGRFGL